MQPEDRSAVVLHFPVKRKPRPKPALAHPVARDQFQNPSLCEIESAGRAGIRARKMGYTREESPYKKPGGRVYAGARPCHLAWLKGWDAAEALRLIESAGRPCLPRKPKKAASA